MSKNDMVALEREFKYSFKNNLDVYKIISKNIHDLNSIGETIYTLVLSSKVFSDYFVNIYTINNEDVKFVDICKFKSYVIHFVMNNEIFNGSTIQAALKKTSYVKLEWLNKNLLIDPLNDYSKFSIFNYDNVADKSVRVVNSKLISVDDVIINPMFDNLNEANGLLIKGENYYVVRDLLQFAKGKVKLIYIDPPYNTDNDQGYHDSFNRSNWLSFMRQRLELAYELLSNDGSIWIQIDDKEHAYLKVMCDEIFGENNFDTNITWERHYSPKNNGTQISRSTDHILVYRKSNKWKPNKLQRSKKNNQHYNYTDNTGRGRFMSGNLASPNNGYFYDIENTVTKRIYTSRTGWRVTEEKFNEMVTDNRIFFGKTGKASPRIKKYLSEMKGVNPRNFWDFEFAGHTDRAKKELIQLFNGESSIFATPKPELLMKRIIEIGSNEGDIVLDFFAGSGSTSAVAHKLNRKWIACEKMDYISTITKKRMIKVINSDLIGISNDIVWKGGGSFYYIETMECNLTEINKTDFEKKLRIKTLGGKTNE